MLAALRNPPIPETPGSPLKLPQSSPLESLITPPRAGDFSLRLVGDGDDQSILPRDDADDEAARPRLLLRSRALSSRPLLSTSNLHSDSVSGSDPSNGDPSANITSATSQVTSRFFSSRACDSKRVPFSTRSSAPKQKGVRPVSPTTDTHSPLEPEEPSSSQKENLRTPKTQTPSKRGGGAGATRQKDKDKVPESATISSGSGSTSTSAPHPSAHSPPPVPAASKGSKGTSEGPTSQEEDEVLKLTTTSAPGQPRIDAQAILRLHLSKGARSAPSRSNPRPKPLLNPEANFFSTPPDDESDDMKAYRRRPPTTPTTALTRHASPIPLPSEDSFTRPTAAEERERWRSENKALRMPIPVPARRVEFETQERNERCEFREVVFFFLS